MSHRQQSFYFILSLPLLLSRRPHHAHESVGGRSSPSILTDGAAPANTSPREQVCSRLTWASLSKDIGSVLKGGVKVCQRQLVTEVLGPLVTEFALNLGREVATPIQGAFNASFLCRAQGVKLIRHNLSVEALSATTSGSCNH
jgi:hypothetical protein